MAKRFIAAMLVIFLSVNLCACSPSPKEIDGVTYQDYGLLNEAEVRNPTIQYEPDWWNIFWGIVFFELFFIPPIYVFGFHCMKPVWKKPAIRGQVL